MNKIDVLGQGGDVNAEQLRRNELIEAQTKKLRQRFGFTRFGSDVPIIPVSANPRGSEELK